MPSLNNSEYGLPPEVEARQGFFKRPSKTHRGRRAKSSGIDHHAEAKAHAAKASNAASPQQTHQHLFRALSSLKKAK